LASSFAVSKSLPFFHFCFFQSEQVNRDTSGYRHYSRVGNSAEGTRHAQCRLRTLSVLKRWRKCQKLKIIRISRLKIEIIFLPNKSFHSKLTAHY